MSSALHPDGKLNPHDSVANTSQNPSILDLIEQRKLSRRGFLKGSAGATAGATAVAVLGSNVVDGLTNYAEAAPAPLGAIEFTSVPFNKFINPADDAVTVPDGYDVKVLVSWGDSLSLKPNWDSAGAMTKAIQERCYGAHTDGMHYFPFPGILGNKRGLLVTNSEYCDPGLVCNTTSYATDPITQDMVDAQLAAHGVNVVTVGKQFFGKDKGEWEIERLSPFNRRITGYTPCKISGPAAGNDLLKTAADDTGTKVLGTLNNCAHGYTPWGTYLTCEENFNGYFGFRIPELDENYKNDPGREYTSTERNDFTAQVPVEFRRYGIGLPVFDSKGKFTGVYDFGYRWSEADKRFDANGNRNEANRFGWVVEIDPWDPKSTPIKRTALGRFKHESAGVVVGADNTVAVYMGDDERNEYVYKFVCAKKLNRHNPKANRDLLDSGILYVAKFDANSTGTWLPLVYGQNGLIPANGFNSQAEVLIKCRQAADRLGATMMDRPEWVAVHPTTREVYLTLTNNNRRGGTTSNAIDGTTTAGSARPPVDTANPRKDNRYGHIIRWLDTDSNVAATTFAWSIFAEAGDSLDTDSNHQGNISGDDYGAPDGLWFDKDGRLWIQTDQVGNATGDWINIGSNVMMCADPLTGATHRFLTSPKNCEVTGVTGTPDGRIMFVGIQHPGEDWVMGFTENSTWPDSGKNGLTTFKGTTVQKPRSSVVVITKDDGGVIGT